MRKLMWFVVGFAAACVAGAYFMPDSGMGILTLGCFAMALLLFLLYGRVPKLRPAAIIALGLAVGTCWFRCFDGLYLRLPRALADQTAGLTVEITDYSYETDYGTAADAVTVLNGVLYRVRIYTGKGLLLCPGDKVQGRFRLRMTYNDPQSSYHQAEGRFLLATAVEEVSIQYSGAPPLKYYPAVLRWQIRRIVQEIFPADTRAFAAALLLGDTDGLSYAQDTAFKVSGIRHVVAVSGLHVSILFSLIYTAVGKRRFLTALLGIPVLLLFALVAGLTPSVTRACVMQSLMILALLVGREYDPPTALSFAVLGMLVGNPLSITSVSFQLSVCCMVGILLLAGRIRSYLLRRLLPDGGKRKSLRTRLAHWIAGSVSVTLSASVTTIPLSAWYFGSVSLVGVVTNLLTLWVITFAFCAIALACVQGGIFLPAGQWMAGLVSWPMRYVLGVSKGLSVFPWAAVYTCNPYAVLWLVSFYLLLGIFLCAPKKRPVMLALCGIVSLLLSLTAAWIEPRVDSFRVTVLDVGQGQCILLQSGGYNYLVDCGGDSDRKAADLTAQTLLSQGIARLDGLILTHFDRDHAGGAALLLTRISADVIYVPEKEPESGVADIVADNSALGLCRVGRRASFPCGKARITLFPGNSEKSDNESGLCILFQAENCDILITGDRSIAGEAELLDRTVLPDLEVLIVGHHGAGDATGMALLSATKPDVAVISVGADNPYGQPAQAVLDRLALFGCEVRRTDLEGTIIIKG